MVTCVANAFAAGIGESKPSSLIRAPPAPRLVLRQGLTAGTRRTEASNITDVCLDDPLHSLSLRRGDTIPLPPLPPPPTLELPLMP